MFKHVNGLVLGRQKRTNVKKAQIMHMIVWSDHSAKNKTASYRIGHIVRFPNLLNLYYPHRKGVNKCNLRLFQAIFHGLG